MYAGPAPHKDRGPVDLLRGWEWKLAKWIFCGVSLT